MSDPLALTAVGTLVLTEGIKFLYTQAGDVLKRWRERRDAKQKDEQLNEAVPVDVKLPDAFEGQLDETKIHFDAVERLAEDVSALRKEVSDYAEGIELIDVQDVNLLANVDALRQVLEAIYQQRITFKGEQRQASGPVVEGQIEVKQVSGYVAAIRAQRIVGGRVTAEAKGEEVHRGGQFISIDVGTIGDHSR